MRGPRSLILAVAALCAASLPAQAEEDGFTATGQLRARYETMDNQFRPGREGGDQALAFRSSVHGRWRGGGWTFGAELMDSRVYMTDEGGTITNSEVSALDLIQLYAAWRPAPGVELTAGRMTMDVGSRRLIERPNFRNTVNTFTGARLDWRLAENTNLLLFYTLPVIRLPEDRESLFDNEVQWDEESADLRFWGAFLRTRNILPGADAEFYLFGLNEDDSASRPTRNRNIYTPGVRLFRDAAETNWDFDLEAVLQFGEARASTNPADVADRDVAAHYVHAELGFSFAAPMAPRLAFIFDHASGDESPADDEINRFDNLFGSRNNDWSPTGIYGPIGPANITAPGAMLEFEPAESMTAHIRWRALFLDEPTDSFASTGVRDEFGSSGDEAGHSIDARLRIQLAEKTRLEFGAAYLARGDFLDTAPNANTEGDTRFAYASIEFGF